MTLLVKMITLWVNVIFIKTNRITRNFDLNKKYYKKIKLKMKNYL